MEANRLNSRKNTVHPNLNPTNTSSRNKLTKISSQPVFKRYKSTKSSYLGHISSKYASKGQEKGQKASSKNSRINSQIGARERSISAGGFYPKKDKIPLSKIDKSKTKEYTSRNIDSSNTQTLVNMNSLAQSKPNGHTRRHRPSVEVINKMTNSTINTDVITPRNKTKLVTKVNLVSKKVNDKSNERGQSSNYRRVRMNRLGKRNGSNTGGDTSTSTKSTKLAAKFRSNSINSNNNDIKSGSKIIKNGLAKSKLRLERKSSEKREILSSKPQNVEKVEKIDNFSSKVDMVTRDLHSARQHRIRYVKKYGVNEPRYEIIKSSKGNKENIEAP